MQIQTELKISGPHLSHEPPSITVKVTREILVHFTWDLSSSH